MAKWYYLQHFWVRLMRTPFSLHRICTMLLLWENFRKTLAYSIFLSDVSEWGKIRIIFFATGHTPCWSVLDFWKIYFKRQVWLTGFLVYFELDFYCLCSLQKSISKLIFAGKKSSSSNLIFQKYSTDGSLSSVRFNYNLGYKPRDLL